jgi:hypothetical protein
MMAYSTSRRQRTYRGTRSPMDGKRRTGFYQRRYLAAVILSSAEVEITLNKDARMRSLGWRTLNIRLLRDAAAKGLPVQ